jgi:hypothetical protein
MVLIEDSFRGGRDTVSIFEGSCILAWRMRLVWRELALDKPMLLRKLLLLG